MFRIFDAFEELLSAAFARGLRDELAEGRARRGVGVLILRDVQTVGARLFNRLDDLPGPAPRRLAGKLDVRDMSANGCFSGDTEQLVERIEYFRPFIAHVADVDAVMRGGDFGQFNDLFGLGEGAGQVDEPG